jgi:hypothetical protein
MARTSVPVTVEVPAVLADERTAERARTLLVLDAVRSERLPWRAAARELGLTPTEFLDLARENAVPVVRYDVGDWRDEAAILDRLERRRGSGR